MYTDAEPPLERFRLLTDFHSMNVSGSRDQLATYLQNCDAYRSTDGTVYWHSKSVEDQCTQ